jgi:hypothetical protein
MERKPHVNIFHKGMVQDMDKLQMSRESYYYAMNGRVIYNVDGTYAFENANGTKFAINVTPDYGSSPANTYTSIGGVELNGILILFLTNGINSEIGLIKQPTFGVFSYQTAFNDKYDPNGQLLGFSTQHPMRDFEVDMENSITENVYFNDYYNEPRVFNIVLGALPVVYNGTPYFTTPYAHPYPPYYSVHGMAQMPDLTWGLAKFNQSISGELLSGSYQYFYRYIHKTGYASPWSVGTPQFFVSTENVNFGNWTQYQMLNSGAQTTKGNQLVLEYLDTRFQQVEVAALYWETDASPTSATTFFKGTIPTNGTLLVNHQFSGSSLDYTTLVQRYTEISKAKTGSLKDNVRNLANYSVFPNLQIDTSKISLAPFARPMLSDTTPVTTTTPFTNQIPSTTTVTVNMADNLPEKYNIYQDYINYKGTQWAGIFKGFFGGEIYPFSITVFDRKGQPFFTQHISDFTFPQRYSNVWTDNRLSGVTTGTTGAVGDYLHTRFSSNTFVTDNTISNDQWILNLMGLKVSGIDLTPILFDAAGNLQVSGFAIMRDARIAQLVAQGVIMSSGGTVDVNNGNQLVTACPTMFNGYIDPTGRAPARYLDTYPPATGLGHLIGFNPSRHNSSTPPTYTPSTGDINAYSARAQIGFFECPDWFINNALFPSTITIPGTVNDTLKIINVCDLGYKQSNTGTPADYEPWQLNGNHQSYYQKNYRSTITNLALPYDSSGNTTLNIGDNITIDQLYPTAQSGLTIFNSITYNTNIAVVDYLNWGNTLYKSFSDRVPHMIFCSGYNTTKNIANNFFGVLTDSFTSPNPDGFGYGAYFIANYIKAIGAYQITETLLQNRTYLPMGHFVPINESILNSVKVGNNYIFNNVEVWGGDCYLDYYHYYRLYCDFNQTHNQNQDYSISIGFPIESQYNIAMRQGNTFEMDGPMPAYSFYNTGGPFYPGGLYYDNAQLYKLEDFNENAVLQAWTTQLFAYVPMPATFIPVYDYPVNEICTGVKIYGEQYDTWRLFPINNFQSADGSKGQINSMQNIFGQLYIIQQSAFARVRFNDREYSSNNTTGTSILLGTQAGYSGHDYINRAYGTQHQFSVVNTGREVHFIDADNGMHLRFAQDGLLSPSDLYGMHNFFSRTTRLYWGLDNPLTGGISSVYDYKNKSVYYTFGALAAANAQTIEYSETESQYKGFHQFYPTLYYNFLGGMYSFAPTSIDSLYVHDEGVKGQIYGQFFPTTINFIVNPEMTEPKWFDNQSVAVNGQAAAAQVQNWTGIVTDYAPQTVNIPSMVILNRARYRQGYLDYGTRAYNAPTRLRGKFMSSTLEIENDASNTAVQISEVQTWFRLSPRL